MRVDRSLRVIARAKAKTDQVAQVREILTALVDALAGKLAVSATSSCRTTTIQLTLRLSNDGPARLQNRRIS